MSSPVTTISEIGKHEGQSVTIRGWLYNLRESGKLLFPQFRDGSGVIQGVIAKNAGTVANGSMITNSELAANRIYSARLTHRFRISDF